ncbi:MAG: DNA polymerase III subunit gamma/tau [Syntrophobacteraceae bacterium]
MSYLVIARKWRPRTFEEVIGQPHVTRTLQNAVRLERIAHAYLFTGARGVGKTSVARILAKSLNCEKGPAPIPCNQCSNCREIAQGNSVDVLEIDGASNRGIDNIRELRETVRYRPAKGRFKVYIIDEVHMLTTEAFNALLKTLEEPPPHVVFIFATTEPHKIPATILSRCQRFDFRRVALPGLVEHLKRITAGEGARFSDPVLYAIAREADGSMRDAQSLLEQLLAFSGDGLPDEEILDILGVIDRRSVLRAGEAVVSGDVEGCLDLVDDLYRRGIDTRRFCRHLCDHFRNLLFLTLGDAREARLDLPDEEKTLLRAQAAKTTPDSLHVYFQMVLRGEEEIRQSSMPKIALEMLLLRMTQLPRLESLDAVLDRIGELENTLRGQCAEGRSPSASTAPGSGRADARDRAPSAQPAPAAKSAEKPMERKPEPEATAPMPPPSPMPPSTPVGAASSRDMGVEPPASTGPVSSRDTGVEPPALVGAASSRDTVAQPPDMEFYPHEAGYVPDEPHFAAPPAHEPSTGIDASAAVERWAEFVRFLEARDPMLWAKVSHCGVRAASSGSIEIEVPDMYEKSANGPEFLEKLDASSDAFFGCGFDWVIIKKSPGPKGAAAQSAKSARPSGKQVVNHPAVQQAIEILGAELVEVKPFRSPGPGVTRGGKKPGRDR